LISLKYLMSSVVFKRSSTNSGRYVVPYLSIIFRPKACDSKVRLAKQELLMPFWSLENKN
jgi:hypothetical protein